MRVFVCVCSPLPAAALAAELGRPAFLRLPAAVMRAVLGEMADETLFASQRVSPAALTAAGFKFHHETVQAALHAALHE